MRGLSLYPLIPANAGTQIIKLIARRIRAEITTQQLRHTIWVPAFAGMSGVGFVFVDLAS
ncbi:hypothetical protein [Phenylobacterium montanum]|uniref:Uncharacterized protein n=1 Tax=Phenylobacterium montanum TaxID=2823693 RepID=A0A975IVZ0_9CAUL|nr:hypothetical protein [Caulobacter sp. S6]QUD87841.1 hypothetical protein KCG34_22820 [Caulobacter sp. S6]